MRAAMAMALSPDAQKRLTVDPGTEVGRPDMTATVLPTFWPCGPSGKPAPRMTSSTCAGSTSGTRRSSSRTHCTAMSSGRARLNEPRNDLARPLRTLATIIASTIGVPIGLRGPARPAFPEERGDGLAAEDHEPRAAGSDDAWQPLRAAATRQDADADFGQADARVLGRDPDVARERDLERATHAEAVDRDDEWLWERLDAVGEALDTLPARVGIRLEERRELRDVGPGAEAARPRAA